MGVPVDLVWRALHELYSTGRIAQGTFNELWERSDRRPVPEEEIAAVEKKAIFLGRTDYSHEDGGGEGKRRIAFLLDCRGKSLVIVFAERRRTRAGHQDSYYIEDIYLKGIHYHIPGW